MKTLLTLILSFCIFTLTHCQNYYSGNVKDITPQYNQLLASIAKYKQDSINYAKWVDAKCILYNSKVDSIKLLKSQIRALLVDTGLYRAQARLYQHMLDTTLISNNKLRAWVNSWNTNQLDSVQLAYCKKLPTEYVNNTNVVSKKKNWPTPAWFKSQTTTYIRKQDGTTDELTVIDLSK